MKLSVIVPVYNLEDYIAAALDSLLSIRFSGEYEIVVVNDGSTDASGEIIRAYQRRNANIRLFTTENQGVSAARNLGIRQAAGQYITFMDGDDTLEPDFFERAVRELDSGGYDFVQGNFRIIEKDREYLRQFTDRDVELCDRREMMRLFLRLCQVIDIGVCGKVFRADVMRRTEFDRSLSISEDQKFIFDVLCGAGRIKLLNQESIHYLQRSGSITHTMNAKKYSDQQRVLKYFKENTPYPEMIPWIEARVVNVLLGHYYDSKKKNDPGAAEIRRQIKRLPYRQMRSYMDKAMRRRVCLHKYAGWLYDLYFMYFKVRRFL